MPQPEQLSDIYANHHDDDSPATSHHYQIINIHWLKRLCLHANFSYSVALSLITSIILLGIAGLVIVPTIAPVLITFTLLLGSYYYLRQRSKNRTLAFERDYPTFLLSLASAVKTGLDPLSAISHTTELLPNDGILTEELKNFLTRVNSSLSEEEAIFFFGQSINFPDLSLFRIALLLARGEGASITSALERLNRITRTRQSFRRKIRGSLAMQRLSSIGITFCSIGILFFQATTNREAFFNTLEHPIGKSAFFIGGLFLIIGLVSMNMIGRNIE